ncbi:unnamed protein product [Lampetra fluviatilis]
MCTLASCDGGNKPAGITGTSGNREIGMAQLAPAQASRLRATDPATSLFTRSGDPPTQVQPQRAVHNDAGRPHALQQRFIILRVCSTELRPRRRQREVKTIVCHSCPEAEPEDLGTLDMFARGGRIDGSRQSPTRETVDSPPRGLLCPKGHARDDDEKEEEEERP